MYFDLCASNGQEAMIFAWINVKAFVCQPAVVPVSPLLSLFLFLSNKTARTLPMKK